MERSVVLFERAQAFAQWTSQPRTCLAQSRNHLLLVLRLFLPSSDGLLAPCVNRFQDDQVLAPEGSNLRHDHRLESLSLTDLDTQFLRHSLAWSVAHRAHRPEDVCVVEHAHKRYSCHL